MSSYQNSREKVNSGIVTELSEASVTAEVKQSLHVQETTNISDV